VLRRAAGEAAAPLSEEVIDRQLATLDTEDRRELVLLWAADPGAPLEQLRDRLTHKTSKKVGVPALRHELSRLGLFDAEEKKSARH